MTVAGMLEPAKAVKSRLQELQKDSTFDELLTKVEDIKRWGPIQLPRARENHRRDSKD